MGGHLGQPRLAHQPGQSPAVPRVRTTFPQQDQEPGPDVVGQVLFGALSSSTSFDFFVTMAFESALASGGISKSMDMALPLGWRRTRNDPYGHRDR